MIDQIQLGDLSVDVERKDIKNIHLSVYPPDGRVRIAAPLHMDLDTIRVYAITRLGWIRQQQQKFHAQERESQREYLDRESHYVWGKRYLLKVFESEQPPFIELAHSHLLLNVRPGADEVRKQAVLEEWYRRQVREAAQPLIERWEERLNVRVARVSVRRMKTRWGSCNPHTASILFNTELAKKNRECLEYIVAHELMHLIEPSHNARFAALMDQHMPNWRLLRDELNQAPLGHVTWAY